jgi:NRPS condensation-like uncharacterized protein
LRSSPKTTKPLALKDGTISIPTSTDRQKKFRLFPLHLTPFEHYMLIDDRPRYPMTFIVQLEMSGKIDREAFTQAVKQALLRHPLLTAIIGPGKQGKDCWIAATDSQPLLDWGAMNEPLKFAAGEFLDIRREIGLRIFVRHDEQRAVITTQFHHASCDGIGSYQYLGDLLYEYAIRTGDAKIQPPIELDPQRLKNRGLASYNLNNFRLPSGGYQRLWDEAFQLMSRTNFELVPAKRKPAGFTPAFPGIQSHTFDKTEYKQLRMAAQSKGQIVNDMLLAKLFETLHDLNHQRRSLWKRNHACVMMPLNLREPADNDISCCNVVAHSFVRRSWRQIQDQEKFYQQLGNELLQIKHERHKIRFMHLLAGGQHYYPRTMKFCLKIKRCMATAILSNTGDPTRQFHANFPVENGALRCGNLLLEDLVGVPPLRPGTSATISIFSYRRVMKICLRCDPNQFSESDSRIVLDAFVDRLKSEIGSSSPER